jgi:hypothetical protein
LVKPGGILYLETPNSDSHLLYREKGDYTFLIPPDHLWLLSRFSIKTMLPKNAEILVTKTYSYSEHLMGIIKRILHPVSLRTLSSSKGKQSACHCTPRNEESLKKKLFYYLFDCLLAPIFTGTLNL